MSNITKIQWCDSTVNPIMGCNGCELFPKPTAITNKLDEAIKAVAPTWKDKQAKTLFAELIDEAYKKLTAPTEHHHNEVTTTNIYDFRKLFIEQVKEEHGKEAAKATKEVIAKQITCYAAKMNMHKGASILNPNRKISKGYAPTFETLTKYKERTADAAKLSDLLGKTDKNSSWKDNLPRMIFVSDMGDAFSDEKDFQYLKDNVMPQITSKQGKKHLWLWLTKRPHIMAKFAEEIGGFPDNVCAMTTITEINSSNLKRLEDLKKVNAKVKGLSIEPLWAELDADQFDLAGIDWAIVGGESGSGKKYTRDFHLEWSENLKQHCKDNSVAFFLKQLGRNPIHKNEKLTLKDSHGGTWDEWPEGYKDREFPQYFHDYRKDELQENSGPRIKKTIKLSPTLSTEEKERLTKLEKTINKNVTVFLTVGEALYEIKSKKLYREAYKTFQEYCDQELGLSRQHVYRLAKASETKVALDPILEAHGLPKASNERMLREFNTVPQDQWGDIIDIASEDVKTSNRTNTTKEISFAKLEAETSKRKKPKVTAPATESEQEEEDKPAEPANANALPANTASEFEVSLERALTLVKSGKTSDAEELILKLAKALHHKEEEEAA